MNIKWIITSVIVAPLVLLKVLYVDVSSQASSLLSDTFTNEWEIGFDSARLNLLTNTVTLRNVVFPANMVTVDVIKYTYLSPDDDELPDALGLSLHNAKGVTNLIRKYYPNIELDSAYTSVTEDDVDIDNVGIDLSIIVTKEDADVLVSLFINADYIQNLNVSFTVEKVFSVINGAYGRYKRGRLYGGVDAINLVDAIEASVQSLFDAKGMNIVLHDIEMTHRVVGVNASHNILSRLPDGSHIDIFFNNLQGHRTYGGVNKGGVTARLDGEVDIAEWLAQPADESVIFLVEKGMVIRKND